MSRFVTCNFLTEPQHAEVCVGFPSDGPIPRCQRCLMQETDPKWAACHSEEMAVADVEVSDPAQASAGEEYEAQRTIVRESGEKEIRRLEFTRHGSEFAGAFAMAAQPDLSVLVAQKDGYLAAFGPNEQDKDATRSMLRRLLQLIDGDTCPSVEEIERQVIRWAEDRGILQQRDSKAQALKAVSEMGELADALIKGDDLGVVDAIGDVMVCLTNLCAMNGLNLLQCYLTAWNAIKDRKGTMSPHGAFVKEEVQS